MSIPRFAEWITNFLGDTLAYSFVWPKKILIPLQEITEEERRACTDVSASGILWVEVVMISSLLQQSTSSSSVLLLQLLLFLLSFFFLLLNFFMDL